MRHGPTRQGQPRYRCRPCPEHRRTLLLASAYTGHSPASKRQIGEMALHAGGMRETARVWHVSPSTVLKECNKAPHLQQVHQAVVPHRHPAHVAIESCRADKLAQRRGLPVSTRCNME